MTDSKLTDEVIGLLSDYIAAFNSYSGTRIAECYVLPSLIFARDGTVRAFGSFDEIVLFFQERAEQLRSQGCRDWRYSNLEVATLGERCVLATMDWEPLRADETPLGKWRQTYQLLETASGLKIVVSTLHSW